MASGAISPDIPYAKRAALSALLGNYASNHAARKGIERNVMGYYDREHPQVFRRNLDGLDKMVTVLQEIYARNVHPRMNIEWNSYPSNLGHRGTAGCFRCHNDDMVDEAGQSISYDCTLCHSILAYDSPEQFQFLMQPDEKAPDRKMHLYLQQEFVGGVSP